MRYPHLVICAFDDWVANQLKPLVAEQKWVLRECRQPAAALAAACEPRPTVLLVQVDPNADALAPLSLVADAARAAPDVAVAVVSDAKLNEADRAAWTAAVFDLGARFVLFPPLTRPVLEDLVSGLMASVCRRD